MLSVTTGPRTENKSGHLFTILCWSCVGVWWVFLRAVRDIVLGSILCIYYPACCRLYFLSRAVEGWAGINFHAWVVLRGQGGHQPDLPTTVNFGHPVSAAICEQGFSGLLPMSTVSQYSGADCCLLYIWVQKSEGFPLVVAVVH
jgi:hypothetical protein